MTAQIVNDEYQPLFQERPRYFLLMGGRGAGRSTVASQFALAKLRSKEYFRCAIMRYILGDIRNSIYREITDRADESDVLDDLDINDSLMTIKYGMNSINAVGFKKSSGDQKAKLKSLANYNCVIIEEADEIPEADFMQLDDSLRTLKGDIMIIFLLNPPPKDHWIIQRFFDLLPSEMKGFYTPVLKPEIENTIYVRTNFRDNIKNLSAESVETYKRYKLTKPSHYWNMIEGLVPEVVRGKIYDTWRVIDEVPYEARLERVGLDYGYSNDPTAIIAIYHYNGAYIVDEVAYRKEMLNKQIADTILNSCNVLTVGDSAEPKSNDELKLYGVNIIGAVKGADSVVHGIQVVQDQKIYVTKRSLNIIKENNNYAWFEDKDGNVINEPKPGWDHAMDAIRYAITSLMKPERKGVHVHRREFKPRVM